MKVLVAGELNPDLLVSGCTSLPVPGKEVMAQDMELSLGSSSAICAVGMARLGNSVSFAGIVGADYYGNYCVDFLRRAGVDVSRVVRRADLKTGVTISITSEKDRALLTYPGAIAALRAGDLPDHFFAGGNHFHVSSWFLQDALRPGLKDRFAAAHRAGLTTSLDTGYDPSETWSQDLFDTLTEVDVFLPNESEIFGITGCSILEKGLEKLDNGKSIIVAKLGGAGCMVRHKGEIMHIPAFRVDVIDTTGAGDSFNAGFLHSWKQGAAMENCLRFASACGALSTRGMGGTATQPDVAEVQSFMMSQGQGVLVEITAKN